MGKTIKLGGGWFCCWIVDVRSLFSRRPDVGRLQPGPSVAPCLDRRQHLLKDGGWDFLQSEKQCFWRKQWGQHLHFSFHWVCWSTCLLENFPAHFSFVSMQILPGGNSFFTSEQALSFPLLFFLSCLSSSKSLHFPLPPGLIVVVCFGDFIEKVGVGGRIMWKEPKMTWFMSGRKLIIKLTTLSQFFADLQSFSQIWTLVSTARENLLGILHPGILLLWKWTCDGSSCLQELWSIGIQCLVCKKECQ